MKTTELLTKGGKSLRKVRTFSRHIFSLFYEPICNKQLMRSLNIVHRQKCYFGKLKPYIAAFLSLYAPLFKVLIYFV